MAGLLGGLLCIPPCRGTWNTTQLGACTHREHAYTGVHTLGELLDHAYSEQGCWCPGPCPVPPMCGALRAARMMAPPASMALGTAQHGHVPSLGTRWMGTKPAGPEAAWLNPSLPQKSQIPALGSPLPSVCVEGGFASSPPLLRYFGAVCPALVSAATVEGVEAMYNRTGGVLRVLPCVLPWVLPSQGRQAGLWVPVLAKALASGWTVAVQAVLGTEHPPNHVQSGGGTAGAQHPGLGAWQGVRARCKRAATGRE